MMRADRGKEEGETEEEEEDERTKQDEEVDARGGRPETPMFQRRDRRAVRRSAGDRGVAGREICRRPRRILFIDNDPATKVISAPDNQGSHGQPSLGGKRCRWLRWNAGGR